MSNTEFDFILKELTEAPKVFRLAIKIYNQMEDGETKEILGAAISEAKENFRMLDVILEDIQWDLEKLEVEKLIDKKMKGEK
tara:strand:- start:373 stop:618 length:246 start_codon:yes stop_codon:yes gene_type:complete